MPRLVHGKHSDAIVETTKAALKEFCTKRGRCDQQLQAHIRDHVQVLVTDAAPAELLASNMLRGRRGEDTRHDPYLPNIVMVGRDAPHATMRILKRPWHAMEDLKDILQSTVTSSNSPTQKIFHSPNFSLWFSEATSRNQGPDVSSLSAAKHRFASFAKPLARLILHVRAYFEVCHRIVASVDAQDCAWCHSWLTDITTRKLLLLACAADAADTLQELTRHLDSEDHDPATLNEEVFIFLEKVKTMFQHGRVFALNGYAHHCLRALEREPPLYVLNDGQQRSLRVTEADKTAVLRSMNPWVRLCTEACEAEFPHFHLFMSLKVLDLKRTTTGSTSAEVRRSLKRLSLALNLDEHRLQSEYECLEPVAKAFVDTQNCSSREAWRQAMVRTQDTAALRTKYQVENLLPLLQAHASWTTSTSGVEQSFSKAERSQGARRFGPKAADTERRSMICLTYKDSPATPIRVSRHLGKHGRVRFDKGVKKKTKLSSGTEKAFIANRRRALLRATKESASLPTPPAEQNDDRLSEKVRVEIRKQQQVVREKKIEACRDGYLLDSDGKDDVMEDAERERLRKHPAQDRILKRKRQERQEVLEYTKRLKNWTWESLGPLAVWFARDAEVRACAPLVREQASWFLTYRFDLFKPLFPQARPKLEGRKVYINKICKLSFLVSSS